MSTRPLVTVNDEEYVTTQSRIRLPVVFRTPIRPDLVSFIADQVIMSTRPLVTVNDQMYEATPSQIRLPAVFRTPIRPDLVSFIADQVRRNERHSHTVNTKAGKQYSAESWGTERAVACIPRVRGVGTLRSGQGASGNMCRGGHMFAPLEVFRRWHRNVNFA